MAIFRWQQLKILKIFLKSCINWRHFLCHAAPYDVKYAPNNLNNLKTDFVYRKQIKIHILAIIKCKKLEIFVKKKSNNPRNHKNDLCARETLQNWPFSGDKNRDLSNFLKIIHKLTSFLTSCSVVWCQKRSNQFQEPQKRILYIEANQNPYIGHFQVTNTLDFSNFLKIIHKLTTSYVV